MNIYIEELKEISLDNTIDISLLENASTIKRISLWNYNSENIELILNLLKDKETILLDIYNSEIPNFTIFNDTFNIQNICIYNLGNKILSYEGINSLNRTIHLEGNLFREEDINNSFLEYSMGFYPEYFID